MSHQDRPQKPSRLLRQKALDFISSRRNANNLVDVLRHLESGSDTSACLLALEMIFTHLLKEREMLVEIVPLKVGEQTPEEKYREWLRGLYEEGFLKVVGLCDGGGKVQQQALAVAVSLLGHEGKFPLEEEVRFPIKRLQHILMKLLSNKWDMRMLVNQFQEYLSYDDVLYYSWKVLVQLTAISNPNEIYITNYLAVLEKLNVAPNNDRRILCDVPDRASTFRYDEIAVHRYLNKSWQRVMLWEHTPNTHKQLLIVLLEKILPHLDKPLALLTDFLMDSLDAGGPIGLLALQGIFTLVQKYNLDYPNIFTKLYSMFEPEIFHTKYKARLFYLSDLFLSSTHLPENLVAAFAKRLARLALIAPSEDVIVICMFIGNLILRHPGLKTLLNTTANDTASTDPYVMEERDPMKSNAMLSSLWEIQSLQRHAVPDVAAAACFVNGALPSVEWDMGAMLDCTAADMFDREVRKQGKLVALAFQRPDGLCPGNHAARIGFDWWRL